MTAPTKLEGATELLVTQVRSAIGTKPQHRGTLRALGLRRVGAHNVLPNRPEIRGMIARVPHLVTVEAVKPETKVPAAKAAKASAPATAAPAARATKSPATKATAAKATAAKATKTTAPAVKAAKEPTTKAPVAKTVASKGQEDAVATPAAPTQEEAK